MKMDITVIVIFALTIFLTMRKGFIGTIAGFMKGILSVAAAYFLAGPLAALIEDSKIGEATEYRISEALSMKLDSSEIYSTLPGMFKAGAESATSGFIAKSATVTGTVDWILGLVMGLILGLIVVFLFLALLFPVASLIVPDRSQDIMSWFDGSFFAQDLYDNNLLLLIFSSLFK